MRLIAPPSIAAIFALSFVLTNCRPDATSFPVPRGLKQATRAEVVVRQHGRPDVTRPAKRQPSPPSSGSCGSPVTGGGISGCTYQPYCNTELLTPLPCHTSTEASFSACLSTCDFESDCITNSYQFSTQQCSLYAGFDTGIANIDYETAFALKCPPGTPPP